MFNGPFSGTTQVSQTRKLKPIWISLKQETVSGSGISWAICKSAPRSRQITMLAPHHSVFLQAACPSCRPTNSIKALKESIFTKQLNGNLMNVCQRKWKYLSTPGIHNNANTQKDDSYQGTYIRITMHGIYKKKPLNTISHFQFQQYSSLGSVAASSVNFNHQLS